MHTRLTAAAIAAGILLTLTACTTEPEPDATVPPSPTAAATRTADAAELTRECVDAVAATIGARPEDFDPENDSDPKPAACNALPEDEYLDAYMDGLSQSNRAALEERQRERDEAAENDP
jgi:hypothetical protein